MGPDLLKVWWSACAACGPACGAAHQALHTQHAVLGLFDFGRNVSLESRSFTLLERSLYLAMAIAVAWPGVYLKYFYLPKLLPELFDAVNNELDVFPQADTWWRDVMDHHLCAIIAAPLDLLLGRESVRAVFKMESESRGVCRSRAAYGWAMLLSTICFVHLFYTLASSKPHIGGKLLEKYVWTATAKMSVVEAFIVMAKAFITTLLMPRSDADALGYALLA